jgi:hypothetical protein
MLGRKAASDMPLTGFVTGGLSRYLRAGDHYGAGGRDFDIAGGG